MRQEMLSTKARLRVRGKAHALIHPDLADLSIFMPGSLILNGHKLCFARTRLFPIVHVLSSSSNTSLLLCRVVLWPVSTLCLEGGRSGSILEAIEDGFANG